MNLSKPVGNVFIIASCKIVQTVEVLLRAAVALDACNDEGQTALHLAARKCHLEVLPVDFPLRRPYFNIEDAVPQRAHTLD